MARKRMVTRTIKTMKVTILAIDLLKAEPYNDTVTITHVIKDKKKLEKEVSALYDLDGIRKVVQVISTETEEKLYKVPEDMFVTMATSLKEEPVDPEI